MKKNLLIALAALVVFSGCSKDDDNPPAEPEKSSAELIAGSTSKSWEIEALFVAGIDQTNAHYEDCDLDDITRLYADGRYEGDEGPIKCYPEDPQIYEQGSWTLSNNNSTLNLIVDNLVDSYTVVKLTETELHVTFNEEGTEYELRMKKK